MKIINFFKMWTFAENISKFNLTVIFKKLFL